MSAGFGIVVVLERDTPEGFAHIIETFTELPPVLDCDLKTWAKKQALLRHPGWDFVCVEEEYFQSQITTKPLDMNEYLSTENTQLKVLLKNCLSLLATQEASMKVEVSSLVHEHISAQRERKVISGKIIRALCR